MTDLFAVLDDEKAHDVIGLYLASPNQALVLCVAIGRKIAETRRRHHSVYFRRFLDAVDAAVPPALGVHLVLDNASTHNRPLIRQWLLKHPRCDVHLIPTSAS
jgi:hypothetical protein